MKKPYKYTIIDIETGKEEYRNNVPSSCETHRYISEIENTNIAHLTEVKKVFVDTRYEAKLRLYNYVTYTRMEIFS